MKKKQTAWESFKSVYSYSSSVISLKIRRGGDLMAIAMIPMAIKKRTKKFKSKPRNLSPSHTTIYLYCISGFDPNELSDIITVMVS
jgi:hypothetical protein